MDKTCIHNLQKSRIYSIIIDSRVSKSKRRVNLILKKKLKYGTKEILKIFNLCLISFGIIIAIVLIKYRPMYEVKIADNSLGYVKNQKAFEEKINSYIENYEAKNVKKIELENEPKLELKLLDKKEETNEDEVFVGVQKNFKITYEYYQIALKNEILASVDTRKEAEELVTELNNKELEIIEKNTENIEEIQTNTIEVAKNNILKTTKASSKANAKTQVKENNRPNINGIKIASTPVSGVISSRYGSSSRLRVSTHTGLDIAAPYGTAIKAVADGTVTCATYSGSYGNLVKINHGNGVETWYAHTSKMYVKPGQKVTGGQTIAAVGSTGNSTGNHLHLEIRINGKHVNPQKYLY